MKSANRTLVYAALLACGLFASRSQAQCNGKAYKIISPVLVAIQCEDQDASLLIGKAIVVPTETPNEKWNGTLRPYSGAAEWLLLQLDAPKQLAAGSKYKIVLQWVPAATAKPTSIDIDTKSKFTVALSSLAGKKRTYVFTSNVLVLPSASACGLHVQDSVDHIRSVPISRCYIPVTKRMAQDAAPDRLILDPEDVGFAEITLTENPAQQSVPLKVDGVTDIFGGTPTVDSKSRLIPPKAPTSKDTASYYISLSDLAATHTSPAWALDAKISPPIGRLHQGFQFNPLATASIGNGQIAGQSYTDAIDLGLTASRIFEVSGGRQGLQLSPGAIYETDREFDRHNLLGTADLRFNFAHSYNTRLRQQEKRLQERRDQQDKIKQDPNNTDSSIVWTLDDVKPPTFGYAYDIHAFVEAGGALVDTTIKATKGTATLLLPRYDIVRIGPKIHTLFEVKRASADVMLTGRYLTKTENSVLQSSSGSLYLKQFQGWKGYLVLTGAIALDQDGHFAFSVTYQDGFNAPKFNRSNAVLTGLAIRY